MGVSFLLTLPPPAESTLAHACTHTYIRTLEQRRPVDLVGEEGVALDLLCVCLARAQAPRRVARQEAREHRAVGFVWGLGVWGSEGWGRACASVL